MPPFGLAPSATTMMVKHAPQRRGPNSLLDDLQIVGNLRNQNDVGATADTRIERNPARVAAHHLDDHDAAVRLGRRVQPIDGVGGEADGGVEPERVGRADDVVVDRLGHADQRDAHLGELVGDGQRAVAADDDQPVEAHCGNISMQRWL